MGLFGKTPKKDPKEQVREWSGKLRKESRILDRQIRGIQREEEKVKRSLKLAAKKNETDVLKILAKEIVQSRKAVARIYTAKANLSSVEMTMKNQAAMVRVAGSLEKSTQVMTAMQTLIKVPEIQKTMQEMSREMMKAGLIEEMMEETFDAVEDQDDLEESTQEEIDKILFEITAGSLGKAPDKVTDELPEVGGPSAVAESDSEEEMEMQQRLEALRS